MPALIACATCSRHVKRTEPACPHCGARLPREGTLLRTATAMLMGLGLTGCVEALYGVPATESDSASGTDGTTTAGTTEGTTEGTGTTDATATSGMSATGTTSTTTTGTTTTDGTTGTTAESTSTTDMTTAEPDYGVPDTTGLLPGR